MPELLPSALGWIDAQKRAVLNTLTDALADPGGTLSMLASAAGENLKDFRARHAAAAQKAMSVMPDVKAQGQEELHKLWEPVATGALSTGGAVANVLSP